MIKSVIGPLLINAEDYDDIEQHGVFVIFNNNPGYGERYIQLIVWRQEHDGVGDFVIVGHNFEYFTYDGINSGAVDSADSPHEVARLLPRMDYGRAMKDIEEFTKNDYERLISGELELHDVF